MKKLITLLLAFILLFSCSIAEEMDYSSMTNDELISAVQAAKHELMQRGLTEEGHLVLLDRDNIKVFWTGKTKMDESFLRLEIIVENKNDQMVHVYPCPWKSFINGWNINGTGFDSIFPNSRRKNDFLFHIGSSGFETMEDIDQLEFTLIVSNEISKKMEEATFLIEADPTTIYFK